MAKFMRKHTRSLVAFANEYRMAKGESHHSGIQKTSLLCSSPQRWFRRHRQPLDDDNANLFWMCYTNLARKLKLPFVQLATDRGAVFSFGFSPVYRFRKQLWEFRSKIDVRLLMRSIVTARQDACAPDEADFACGIFSYGILVDDLPEQETLPITSRRAYTLRMWKTPWHRIDNVLVSLAVPASLRGIA